MEPKKLIPTVLTAPFPVKGGVSIVPSVVFAAGLSMMAGSHPVAAQGAAGYSPTLPPVGELDVDFRCEDANNCPLDLTDPAGTGILDVSDIDEGKYLMFTATGDTECGYTPLDVGNSVDGVGVIEDGCGDTEATGITSEPRFQQIEITVMDDNDTPGDILDDFESSLPMTGIYLFPLTSATDESFSGEGCYPLDRGVVEVEFDDGSTQGDATEIDYRSDIRGIDPDNEDFDCATEADQALLLGFGAELEVTRLFVRPEPIFDFNTGGGTFQPSDVFIAGLQSDPIPDVGPVSCAGDGSGNNTDCRIDIGGGLNDQDFQAVIQDETIEGNITVESRIVGEVEVQGPWRIRDYRSQCQPGAANVVPTEAMVFDPTQSFDVYATDPDTGNVLQFLDTILPLPVSESTSAYYTIPATSCGIPRSGFDGSPVARTPTDQPGDWIPYIDVVEIASDILPLAAVVGFESNDFNFGTYACRSPGPATLATQPLVEINARDDEAKVLQGPVPGVLTEVARDITIDCGSKRGRFRGYSFVSWNTVHHPLTDIWSEIDAEIQALADSATRYASCVTPSFYYGQLVPWPIYINQYFDAGVDFAALGNASFAGVYYDAALTMIGLFQSSLEAPGRKDELLACFTSGPEYTDITTSSGGGNLPLNAWGDLISQLEHLSYGIRTFKDELVQVPPTP